MKCTAAEMSAATAVTIRTMGNLLVGRAGCRRGAGGAAASHVSITGLRTGRFTVGAPALRPSVRPEGRAPVLGPSEPRPGPTRVTVDDRPPTAATRSATTPRGGAMTLQARAFWVREPGVGEIRTAAVPDPGPGEVLVRSLRSGISR